MTAAPRFYWTAHPRALLRTRLLPNAHVLIVAAAVWDAAQQCFKWIVTEPRDAPLDWCTITDYACQRDTELD